VPNDVPEVEGVERTLVVVITWTCWFTVNLVEGRGSVVAEIANVPLSFPAASIAETAYE
jgi:hypothetical protein